MEPVKIVLIMRELRTMVRTADQMFVMSFNSIFILLMAHVKFVHHLLELRIKVRSVHLINVITKKSNWRMVLANFVQIIR